MDVNVINGYLEKFLLNVAMSSTKNKTILTNPVVSYLW